MSFLVLLVFTTNCRKETDYTNHLANSTPAILRQSLALEPTSDTNFIEYCESIIEISDQMINILISEENIDSTYLENPYLDSLSTFQSVFSDAGFSSNIEMSNLMEDILNLAATLMEESPYLDDMSEDELEDLFSLVINDLIDEEEILVGATPGDVCRIRRDNAVSKCQAMAGVGLAAAGVSALFGFGTLIGAVTVLFSLNECLNSAGLDYKFCLKNY
tara:strand:- start:1002 stop:1655 length:654 start_codon:yes stop_codon:yes gene_type:complete